MEKGEKKQKIQWDEETIAEHDKERGSRQKIDEAPTPFRYQSESDQSECESDAESLARKSLEDGEDEAATVGVSQQRQGKKKKNVLFNSNANNKISDSWETVNAKLQYEKHLQDTAAGGTSTGIYLPRNGVNSDSVQRSQFYMSSGSGSNSNSNIAGGTGSPKVTMAGAGKIMDLQTNFGEMVHSAPAAFSPQFTRKNYRTSGSAGKHASSSTGSNGAIDGVVEDPRIAAHSPVPSPIRSISSNPQLQPPSSAEKLPKTVFIKATGEIDSVNEQVCAPTEEHNGENMAVSCGSVSGDDDGGSGKHSKQFLNKRAGHYNEFKVLQAMRAKLAAEDDEDDEDDI